MKKAAFEGGGAAGGCGEDKRHAEQSLRVDPVAFFNRLSLVDPLTKKRILARPFYSDNYVSVLPGESRTITMEYRPGRPGWLRRRLSVEGWNVE